MELSCKSKAFATKPHDVEKTHNNTHIIIEITIKNTFIVKIILFCFITFQSPLYFEGPDYYKFIRNH